MQDLHDLRIVIESKIPIVVIETYEEPRALEILRRLAVPLCQPVYGWSITDGLKRIDLSDEAPQRVTAEPVSALGHIKSMSTSGIYALCDIHPFIRDDPKVIRLIKEISMEHKELGHTLVLISHEVEIPPEIKRYSVRFKMSLPNDDQLLSIVREEAARWSQANENQRVKTDNRSLMKLVSNLQGLTFQDARRLAHGAIANDGCITVNDIPEVNKAKYALMNMDGVLSFEYDTASFAEVGGLANLKKWLEVRKEAFMGTGNQGLDRPKGLMLLGIQGGGKSLAAKAVAGAWGIPLLRLDFGGLYNKYIGESEKNLGEALALADKMAPCVLWMDEIEKGLSTEENDNGTSKRLLGSLLTWMAERSTSVFLVATSNDISKLPPELVRKGRLDEIFFVDLPERDVREIIFEIHLSKREQDSSQFDLARLAMSSGGFSGAEIEQAVVSGLYSAAATEEKLNTMHIVQALADTSPLSVVMEEKMEALRSWADSRAVRAN